jgi:quercetin dioxygenase-like cupin family protein
VLPLTQGPVGVQAWKIILTATSPPSELRRHDGHEWLYVLSGRMHLLLDQQELVLGVGEAIEFDTAEPHWFGAADDRPAEVLSLFGRPGEQIRHVEQGPGRRSRT